MALRFIDSFDHYQADQMPAKWTTVHENTPAPEILVGGGRCGTNCLRMRFSATAFVTKGLAFATTTVVCGFAQQWVQFSTINNLKFFFFNASGDEQLSLSRAEDGSLHVYRMDTASGVLLASSAPDVVRTLNWYYIEFKATIDNAAGAIEVRVNGATVISAAGIDTQASGAPASVTEIKFDSLGGQVNYLIDDLYALDSSGGAPNNDFLGDSRVEYLRPTAPGFHQDWAVVGIGTHWQAVNDGDAPDDDVTYITATIVGATDTQEYSNTGLPSGTIFGVQIGLYARKTDSGLRSVAPVIRHAGADFVGSNFNPSFPSYTYLMQVYETNPGTAAPWTIADVNGDEYGIQVTA
jgi:hypothetical protein